MALVDPGYGAWLAAPARYVTALRPEAAAFGDSAVTSTIVSPIALKDAAQAEANRQAQFLAGPIARDTVVVPGLRKDLIGRVVTIIGDRLGYEGGATVFVLATQESERAEVTTLTVLKRLA